MLKLSAFVTAAVLALGATASAQPVDPYDDTYDQTYAPDVAAPEAAPPPIAVNQAAPEGQWVYTQQYGWVWQPYGDQYVRSDYDNPYAYVYYPSQGWTWLSAPWVVGVGVRPYFGSYGYAHYRWYPRHHEWRAGTWSRPRVIIRGGYNNYGGGHHVRGGYVRGGGGYHVRGGGGFHGGGFHGGGRGHRR
ncbi:MAG TPA: hypothetical protein VL463_08775 [Kofleriaceae bacterium]|nr:hypothetical protein [Kofleriaceae bacterium]